MLDLTKDVNFIQMHLHINLLTKEMSHSLKKVCYVYEKNTKV